MLNNNKNTKQLMKLTKKDLVSKIFEFNRKENFTSNSQGDDDEILKRVVELEKAVLTLREENTLLNDEIANLKTNIKDLQEEIDVLQDDLFNVEKDLYSTQQYSRRWNIEICNIPDELNQDELEPAVLHALSYLDVNINARDLEAVHRLQKRSNESKNSPKTVIVRFKNRKDAFKTLKNKRLSNTVPKNTFGLTCNKNIFIQESLCPHYRSIYEYCQQRRDWGDIHKVWTYKGIVNILFDDDDQEIPTRILHYEDLWDIFSDDYLTLYN